jgi:hypothetical protein
MSPLSHIASLLAAAFVAVAIGAPLLSHAAQIVTV